MATSDLSATVDEHSKVDDLVFGQEIGHGAFATVRECHQKGQEMGAPTAVKIVSMEMAKKAPHWQGVDALRARLDRMLELNELSTDGHIIRFLDYRIGKDDLLLIFTFCKGGDMFSRIIDSPQGHYNEEDARLATFNLLKVLLQLGTVGIIHRDIKPENILYHEGSDPLSAVVITDFGLCVYDTQPGETFTEQVGTPGYIAPEIVRGRPYGPKVDIFSLGITVYEMCTGQSPWLSDSPDELMRECVHRPIPFPKHIWEHISPTGLDCVMCMLEKDPEERWSAVELMHHPWFSGLTETLGPDMKELVEEARTTNDDDWTTTTMSTRASTRSQGSSFTIDSPASEGTSETSHASRAMTTRIATKSPTLRKKPDPHALEGMFETKLVLEGKVPEEFSARLKEAHG